jgi:hypothetical protein
MKLAIAILFCAMLIFTTCVDSGENLRGVVFISSNWGDDSIKIINDILSLEDGATAAPREIVGNLTTITNPGVDSLAVDKQRGILYVADNDTGSVLVFENLSTVEGNVAPDRVIAISGATRLEGIHVDSLHPANRLYVSGNDGTGGHLWIFNNASMLEGTPAPDAIINVTFMSIFVDEVNDVLYAGEVYDQNNTIYIFENASTYTTGTLYDRLIVFTSNLDPTGLWVDPVSDRLYVCDNGFSPGGNHLFIFNNASTMQGSYDPDIDSIARINVETISLMVDSSDNLYAWPDSADHVKIYYNASTLTGDVSGPDKTIYGVVNKGLGMDFLTY